MTRIGASQVFFNVVAQWNADKMIRDTKTQMTVMKAVVLDSFEAMLKPVDDFTNSLNMMTAEMSEASQELGKAKIEFEKFFGSDNLDATADSLIRIGEAYGIVAHEALAAGSRAAQVANLIGKQNIDLLVNQAQILSNISDLNSEEAMRGMIQLQQQTGLLTADMTSAQFQSLSVMEQKNLLLEQSAVMLDTLNTIANRSVAMEGDLVKTLSNFAAQGDLIGESFADMAAMSAVLLEAGEEQGASGRALRMMYARLGGNISGTRDKLEALGIATKDENGNLLTMRELMDGLIRDGYEQLNAEQKQNIAQIISGNRHYVRFIKLMENHNRVVKLAADGTAGFDSAQQQSARAMATMTMELERQRARAENLKAAMGTEMTPFMIGQLEAQNNLRESYLNMMDVMPTLGKVFGRLLGSFEMFEGFLRFSIGLQSMAIGFEMMDSVQRSLHGILIANENLHSKQATYMASGVQASAEQNAIMNEIRYQSQLLNTLQERMRMAKHEMLAIDQERLPLIEREGQRLATMAEQTELIGEKKKEMERTEFLLKTLSDGRLNDSTKIARILDESVEHTKELHKTFNAINDGSLGELSIRSERFASQMLVNSKVMNDLSEEQNIKIRARQQELRREHTVLQMIKAENQAAYQLREGQNQQLANQKPLIKDLSFSMNDMKLAVEMFNLELDKAEENLAKTVKTENVDGVDRITKAFKKADAQVQHISEVISMLHRKMQGDDTQAADLGKVGAGVLERMMKSRMGEMIEIQKIIDMQSVKEMELGEIQNRRALLLETINQLEHENSVTKVGLNRIMRELVPLEDMYAAAQGIVEQAERDRVDIGETKKRLIYAMKAGVESLTEAEQMAINVQANFVKSQENLTMSAKRMTMALSSAFTVVSGAMGMRGPMAASITSFGMLAPAIATATKSITEYAKNLKKMAALESNLAFHKRTHIRQLGKTIGLYGTLIGIMYLYNNEKEKEAKMAERINEFSLTQQNVQQRLLSGANENLIANEDLAEQLGLQGVRLQDIHKSEELRLKIVSQLTGVMEDFTGENRKAVEEALALANAVGALTDGMSELVRIQMAANSMRVKDETGGFFGFFKEMPETFSLMYGIGDEARKQNDLFRKMQRELGEDEMGTTEMLFNDENIALIERYTQHLADLETPRRLTQDEMDIISTRFDSDLVDTYIESLNNAIVASGDLSIIESQLDRDFSQTSASIGGMVDEIENLTEEIYQFGGAREELFFGGKFGNVTGSLYKQVVSQGVGTLYNKNEVLVTNQFHGFFNEQEAADRIIRIVTQHLNTV